MEIVDKVTQNHVNRYKELTSKVTSKHTLDYVRLVWKRYYTWKCLGYITSGEIDRKVSLDTGLTIGQVKYIREHYPPDIGEIK